MVVGTEKNHAVLLKFVALIIAMVIGYSVARHRSEAQVKRESLLAFNLVREPMGLSVSWYPADLNTNFECVPSEAIIRYVLVRNHSKYIVSSGRKERPSNPPVNIAYRLYRIGTMDHFYESERSYISGALGTEEQKKFDVESIVPVRILCPDTEEPVKITVEAVQEGVAWQHDVTTEQSFAVAQLRRIRIPELSAEPILRDGHSMDEISMAATNRHHIQFADVIKAQNISENLLRLTRSKLYEPSGAAVSVWTAGSTYPQIWVRDMAFLQEALNRRGQKLPPGENFWPQIFLDFQSGEGEIYDWVTLYDIEGEPRYSKNSIQSDQELWLAWAVLKSILHGYIDRDWLRVAIRDHSIGERVNMAIRWTLRNRYDANLNCVWSGHVADWGDVGMKGNNEQDSTKMATNEMRTCGIFLQALLYWTLDAYEKVFSPRAMGDILMEYPNLLADWRTVLRSFAAESLWSEERGYFLMHLHPQYSSHGAVEANMFSLGGNVLAAESGLATDAQSERIANAILMKKQEYHLNTVGYVLIPPYPQGTFENPVMDDEWEYQNGGDWDWYGFRAASLISKYNRADGEREFRAICSKIAQQGTYFEWNARDGIGHGAKNMRVGAAAIWW